MRRPRFSLSLRRSPSSTIPNTRLVSCKKRVISAQKVKAVPSAGLTVVVEKVDSGLLGTLDTVVLVIYHQHGPGDCRRTIVVSSRSCVSSARSSMAVIIAA